MPTSDQKKLKALLERRHPEYEASFPHWSFLEATYNGGRDWFYANIFKFFKEGGSEFQDRLERAYRFNHTREVVDLVNKYIFKSPITRSEEAPEELKAFWKSATMSDLDINQFMAMISSKTSIFGRIWCIVDNNKTADVLTKADEKASNSRVYAYVVKPQNVLDVSFDDQGAINWIMVCEFVRDDNDPFDASGGQSERYRLWTKNESHLFEYVEAGSRGQMVKLVETKYHGLGVVPAFPCDHMIGEFRWTSPGLINDIAYLDRATANYLSNLDAIIQDQTFSQLAIPAQALGQSDEKDGINKIISEIYHTIGMAGERTKTDNAMGIDNSSGVAKAYDFDRVNSLLSSKANALKNAESWLTWLVMKWHSVDDEKDYVSYPDTFDVRSLFDEFTIAEKLSLVDAPKDIRREQMKQVIAKLWPQITAELRKKLEAELPQWLELDEAELLKSVPGASRGKPAASKRQGQVTENTK